MRRMRESDGAPLTVWAVSNPPADREGVDPMGPIEVELPELGPEWRVIVTPRITPAGPVIDSLTIRPSPDPEHAPPDSGLTREHLDRIQVRTLRTAIRNAVALLRGPEHPYRDRLPVEVWDRWEQQPHPGRAGHPDLEYALLAAKYVELVQTSEHPVRDLAKAEGRSEPRIRGLLTAARSRGLLTAAPSGRAGGELTDKAKALLGGQR